jgi:hypothetical protein
MKKHPRSHGSGVLEGVEFCYIKISAGIPWAISRNSIAPDATAPNNAVTTVTRTIPMVSRKPTGGRLSSVLADTHVIFSGPATQTGDGFGGTFAGRVVEVARIFGRLIGEF